MTLRRKILLRSAAILIAVALLSIAAVLGLNSLRNDVSIALEEYDELRVFEQTGMHIGLATGLLSDDHPDATAITEQIDLAISALGRFDQMHEFIEEVAPGHEEEEKALADSLHTRLKSVRENILTGHDKSDQIEILETVLIDLNSLSHEADEVVTSTHHGATHKLRMTTIVLSGLSILVFVVIIGMVVWQYRGIIEPLHRLRLGVRTIASGQFKERLPTESEVEFSDLATEFNRMAQELDELYRSLEEKVMAKSKELIRSERLASVGFLAAGVAHEINNPLSIISGYAEMTLKYLRTDGQEGGDAKESSRVSTALQVIFEESFRCKQITEKLLSLSKPGSSSRGRLSLTHVAEEVGEMVRAVMEYRDRSLSFQFDPAVRLFVLANESEMKQVLLNLTINALQSVRPGNGKVSVSGKRDNGWVELSVQDNGCGMTPEVLDQVFEPFFSQRRDEVPRGVGLGMSITHAIIEAHGGRIHAESSGPGSGSRFVIQLPAYDEGSST